MIAAFCVGVLARIVVRREKIELPPLSGWVIAFVVLVLVEAANPHTFGILKVIGGFRQHLEWIPFFFVGYYLMRSKHRFRNLFLLLGVIALANGVVSTIQTQLTPEQLAAWGPGYEERITGSGDVSGRVYADNEGTERVRPPALGSDLGFGGFVGVLALPGLLALLGARGMRRQPWVVLLCLGSLLAVATSLQRQAVLGAVIAAVALAVLSASAGRRATNVLAGLLVIATLGFALASALAPSAGEGVFSRYESITPDKAATTSVDYRQATIAQIPAVVEKYPLGAGLAIAGAGKSFGGTSHADHRRSLRQRRVPVQLRDPRTRPAGLDPLGRALDHLDRPGRDRAAADRRRRAAPPPGRGLRRRDRLHDHGLRRTDDVEPSVRTVLLVRARDRRLLVQDQTGAGTPRTAMSSVAADSRTLSASICICTRNRPAELRRALDSIAASSLQPSQVVVSDDGDEDGVAALVAAHPLPIVYTEGPRSGLGANRNHAISVATGDYLLFLDDDGALGETFLEQVESVLSGLDPERRARTIVTGADIEDGRLVVPNDQGLLGFSRVPTGRGRLCAPSSSTPRSSRAGSSRASVSTPTSGTASTRSTSPPRRWRMGFTIVPCFDAVNYHFPSPVGRDEYRDLASASRLYVTLKRRRWTEGSRLRAWARLRPRGRASVRRLGQAQRPRRDRRGPADGWPGTRLLRGLSRRQRRS